VSVLLASRPERLGRRLLAPSMPRCGSVACDINEIRRRRRPSLRASLQWKVQELLGWCLPWRQAQEDRSARESPGLRG
jgi:hypothetical protein